MLESISIFTTPQATKLMPAKMEIKTIIIARTRVPTAKNSPLLSKRRALATNRATVTITQNRNANTAPINLLLIFSDFIPSHKRTLFTMRTFGKSREEGMEGI
jgi:hypothetical protein